MDARSQYHHYIPRFILRRWAVDGRLKSDAEVYQPPYKVKQGFLNVYDIAQDTLSLGKETISCTFGMTDMYKDASHEKDVYHIEKSLSRLDEAASQVISKLESAVEKSDGSITLLQSEVNTLWKFLFIMGLRHPAQYVNWRDGLLDSATMYTLRAFTHEQGLTSTHDAYLLTIRQLLDTEPWKIPDNPKIFSVTRGEYKMDQDMMSLGFYAAPPGVEFILSEAAFGVWQGVRGPAGLLASPTSPMTEDVTLICSRLFPVTPKLAVILRHKSMTREGDDHSWTPNSLGVHLERSYLANLPFQSPTVVYDPPLFFSTSGLECSSASLGGPKPIQARLLDRFTFPVIALSDTHAYMINNMLLENCIGRITFIDVFLLYKSIRTYYRDTELEHKVDHMKFKVKLLDAFHNPSRYMFYSSHTKAGATDQGVAPTPPSPPNVSQVRPQVVKKGKTASGALPTQCPVKSVGRSPVDHPIPDAKGKQRQKLCIHIRCGPYCVFCD